ncbi:hypothetical protein HZA87_04945 [Candidatus Uhrbacteria bacterium]|nr:hypothetical protein [Candidatus Uhrbacteria bacterium]
MIVTIGGAIYLSDDGGDSWDAQTVPADFGTIMYDVQYGTYLSHVSGPTDLFALDLSTLTAPSNFYTVEADVTDESSEEVDEAARRHL